MRTHVATRGRALLRNLSRRWLAILVLPVIYGVGIYIAAADDQPRFQSTSSVLLQTTDLGAVLAGVPDLGGNDPYRTVATERIIGSVPQVRERALESIGEAGTPEGSSAEISFDGAQSFSAGDADVLDITVTGNNESFAENLATAVAREYIAFRAEVANSEITKARDQVRTRIDEIRGDPGAATEFNALVDRAEKLETLLLIGNDRARLLTEGSAAVQIAPTPLRKAVIAGVIGLLLGIALVLVAERFDNSVRSGEEIAAELGAPILASLPDPRRLGAKGPVVTLEAPSSAESEAFRLLRANLRFGLLAREGHSVGVTSGVEGEGKTFVSTNLAVVAAAAGARVVLVDLDLRKPTVHQSFGVDRYPGVSDVLTSTSSLEESLVLVETPEFGAVDGARGSLQLLCAGTQTPNPGEVAASMALRTLIRRLEDMFDLVIVDTPPLSVVNDAMPVADSVSGMIAVVRSPRARRPVVAALAEALRPAGGAMGVVLTAEWRAPASYYTYTSEHDGPRPDDARESSRSISRLD